VACHRYTGFVRRYDFDQEFASDERLWGGILKRPADSDKPDLFKAIQEQIGLRPEATTGSVDSIVMPSSDL